VRIGHLDLVRPGVGAARLVDGHRQRVRVLLPVHRVDAELEPVARLERRVAAVPFRVGLRRRFDLAAKHDRLAVLP